MDKSKTKEFLKKKAELEMDKDAVKSQHKKGRLTARERLKMLLDEGSFIEIQPFAKTTNQALQPKKKAGDGVITGYGKIGNRPVYFYIQDFTFIGGSMGEQHTRKIAHVIDLAVKNGCPIIGLLDSGGARIQEGISGLDGGGSIFLKNTKASGVIPQISCILGPCAGIAVYSPAITDFILMVNKTSNMFITGPEVIKSVTGEDIDFEGLGGAAAHNQKSGVAHFSLDSEKDAISMIKLLLTYLPQNNIENPPVVNTNDSPIRPNNSLKDLIPSDSKKAYDVKEILKDVLDKKSFLEIHGGYAKNIVVGLGRLNNSVVGVVANQPNVLAGCLDINSSDKIARFVRFCDCFNIPLINFVDVTGYLPGTDQEHNGIIRHGAKMLFAYSEATVPKISVVMRKAYGGAYIALVSKDMGYDHVIAWPSAEIAVMGAEQAVNIVNRKDIANSKDPQKKRQEKIKEYSDKFLNPYVAAELGKVDQVIDCKDTRKVLVKTLESLMNKRELRPKKKHGNIPL